MDVIGFSHLNVAGLSDEEIIRVRKQHRDRKILKKLETYFRNINDVDLLFNTFRLGYF